MIDSRNSNVYQNEKNELIIRCARPGDVIYYVDGVKSISVPVLPNSSIQKMTLYLSGIPAKYGDTTGSIVIVETTGYFDLYYEWLSKQY